LHHIDVGRTDRELFWIKELGTAMPYGCNDNIKGVGNLSSPGCNEINVMSLFNTIRGNLRVVKIRLYECDEFQEVSVY
jgi:hypothetical protein